MIIVYCNNFLSGKLSSNYLGFSMGVLASLWITIKMINNNNK